VILKWLARTVKPAADEVASHYLDSITGSAAAVLQQVIDWVDEQKQSGLVDLELLRQADKRLEPVLAEIVGSLATNRRLGTGHKLLRSYCENFAHTYALVADRIPRQSRDLLTALLRAAYLYSWACRLARMNHSDPDVLRQEIMTAYMRAQQAGIADQAMSPYAGIGQTCIKQELAVALLWETVPFDTLSHEQTDYLERFMVSHGGQIVLSKTKGPRSSYAVQLDGRVAMSDLIEAEEVALFIGPGSLVGQMAGICKWPDGHPLPAWAEPALAHTDIRTIKTLAQRMVAAWEQKRVQRGHERQQRSDTVRVTGGLINIRRVVAYSAYLRNGGKLNAYETAGRLFTDEMQQILVGIDRVEKQLTPIEVLLAMEGAGESRAVESWAVADSSAQGYSLFVPGYRRWLAVGDLMAVRESDRIDWNVAVVRRLYGPANGRKAGVELYGGHPVPVGLGGDGQTGQISIAELRDAILIKGDTENWLITSFDCSEGGTHMVVSQYGRQKYRIIGRSYISAECHIYGCERIE
jgi:hypothetical protein